MGDHARAAFLMLRAHAAEEPNLQDGLFFLFHRAGHEWPLREIAPFAAQWTNW